MFFLQGMHYLHRVCDIKFLFKPNTPCRLIILNEVVTFMVERATTFPIVGKGCD